MDRVSCTLFLSHRQARWLAGLGALDLLFCFIFITLPDNRDSDYPNSELIFGVQMAGAWLNLALTVGCLVLVWVTYSVPQRKLTFEREARAQYLAVVKFVQLLLDMMLTAFPTTMRQFVALFILTIQIVQIFYALYVVRRARDVFTRRIRPPLVIKALLDMTGERAAEVDPFTLDMLERLEGLVKVRTQMKFSVRSGRQFLVFGVAALLVASLFQYSWEFAKILSYGNRYFTRSQIETIMSEANLPMYWPSYAADPQGGGVGDAWDYRPGGAGCQASASCRFPRDESNSRPYPIPNGGQRVVLVVFSGLNADREYVDFLRFRTRAGWTTDGIELVMRNQLPTNAVPNWFATLTGLSPDLAGIFGNRDIGRSAYDNIFRVMSRFREKWWTTLPDEERQYEALMAGSPWFTGQAKSDLPKLIGDGSVSYVANEDDIYNREEIFQSSTYEKDVLRQKSVAMALNDPGRDYHFLLLHLTDADSQASNYGRTDKFNQRNSASNGTDAPWEEFTPPDLVGTSWRKNSYKRAIARGGDLVDELIDRFGDLRTTFLIVGDHGHVAPGGSGGTTQDVSLVPFFAYRRGSQLGTRHRTARRVAGSSSLLDGARFVARARRLDEYTDVPVVVPNDKCDIMGESSGGIHKNTCDEWRRDGEYTVENVDVAPTVMALLGLPVPRTAIGVFIDDVMGNIGGEDADLSPMIGGNCTAGHLSAEVGAAARSRLDRTCFLSYGTNEDPSVVPSPSGGWSAARFQRWHHVIHYRDLFQQKLAFVRGYLRSVGTLDLRESAGYAFLKATPSAAQYYDEGAEGRCAAYDPFNPRGNPALVPPSHRYTITPLEYGKCGSCSSAEKKFVTGEELAVRGTIVCTANNLNLVKQYYIQGIKGLLVLYNREIASVKRIHLARNLGLVFAFTTAIFAGFVFVIASSTLADPWELVRRHRGQEYSRSYFKRPDVIAAIWALALIIFYYSASILTYILLQNMLGYTAWDASVLLGQATGLLIFFLIAFLPACFYALVARGLYMFHYRYVPETDMFQQASRSMLSPSRLARFVTQFFGRNMRVSDMGIVYLIRVYLTLGCAAAAIIITLLHSVYSFIIPFIFRMEHLDTSNWTLRFQIVTVQLASFPLWVDTWYSLYELGKMRIDGVSVSQLYDMRSDKEERFAEGFSPEDEEQQALTFGNERGGDDSKSSTLEKSSALEKSSTLGGGRQRGLGGNVGKGDADELKKKLASVELDRTLCMNRIAQLEEELDTIKESKADALTDAKLNSEFLGQGFADLQVLLETGFKQLERFYLETGTGSGAVDKDGKATAKYRNAVEETMAQLRDEAAAALERQRSLLEALSALDGAPAEAEEGVGDDAFFAQHAQVIEQKLVQAKQIRDELSRTERQRDELSRQVSYLEREAVVQADEMEKTNDDLAGVQAERDLLERKVNELRRELHAKNKEIEAVDAELKLSKSQNVRAMARISVQKAKAEKQLAAMRSQLKKLDEDKSALFREVSSLEAQLAQAHADREEARNWASTYRDMLLKVA